MNKEILKEALNQKYIKSRKEGFANVGYITAKHAIQEANRAFDYDGWSSETLDMTMVQSELKNKKDNETIKLHYIGYTCKVRINVDNITRDGFGFGQGIDRDLGKAHESATKEAESDAIKRALRTFGDIFGLALYDKDTGNITTEKEEDYQIITSEQVKYIRKLNQTAKMEEKEVCTFLMLDKLEDLKGKDFDKVINMINNRIEKNKEKENK